MIQYKQTDTDEIIFEIEDHAKIPRQNEIVFLPTSDPTVKKHPKYSVSNVHYSYKYKRMSSAYEEQIIIYVNLEKQ